MIQPFGRSGHVSTVDGEGERLLVAPEHHVTAHAGGQVDDHVNVGGTDPIDHFTVQVDISGPDSGERVTHVDVHDGRTRPCGVES